MYPCLIFGSRFTDMHMQLINNFRRFHPVPDEDIALIAGAFQQQRYQEGEYLFRGAGKVCNRLFFIHEGVVRIASINEKGNDVTHYFYREDQTCTLLQSFNEQTPTDTHIIACCDVLVSVISRDQLIALYSIRPYLKELLHRISQDQLLQKVHVRNAYLGEDAESRYRIFIGQQADIALRVSLKDIASFLGITPQSLSRIRRNIR